MTSDSYEGTNGEDNDKTTVYEAWTGSENVTLKYDGATGTPKHAGDVLIYTADGDKFINVETASDVDVVKVAITGIEKVKEGDVAVRFANGTSKTYSMTRIAYTSQLTTTSRKAWKVLLWIRFLWLRSTPLASTTLTLGS